MRRTLSAARVAVVAALALLLTVLALPAVAATSGITSNLLLNGATYHGTEVVNEGDELTLRVQYDTQVQPGATVDFELGPNVKVTGVPAANTAIESVRQDGNKVAITFKDPWPSGVNQGVFDLKFTVNQVDGSAEDTIVWKVDGQESSIEVIVRDSGDEFANVSEGFSKGVAPGNLESFVTVVDGRVRLKPEIVDQDLTYTLRVNSPEARDDFEIADRLPAGLGYVAGSFGGQLTSWDAAGLNRKTAPFTFAPTVTGQQFSGDVDLPGPSILAITYRAEVTDVAAIEALLQAQYDRLSGGYGQFETVLTNTASFGSASVVREAGVRLRHSVANPNPGPNVGALFGKTAAWGTKNIVTDEAGNLTPPADLTYTLKADLRGWDGSNPNKVLGRNVVISDTLPTQASWRTDAADFLTSTGVTLTKAETCPTSAAAFAGDAFVGQYCVDGQRLLVNVGKDATTNASIAVKAQLTTVDGLAVAGSTTIKDATPYRWRNVADFHYRDGNPHSVTRDVTVVALPDTTGGVNDPSVFTKTGAARQQSVEPGESVTVDYTFTVAAGKGIDVRHSRIVDHVDTDVYDLGDLSGVTVKGTYDGVALDASHFELRTNADDDLVIELSSAGDAVVSARGADKRFQVTIALTTKEFVGKETKTIRNKATLFGLDGVPLHWSDTVSEATSYGDEAEVRKRIWDNVAQEWTESIAAQMDGSGSLVQDRYVYRIEFIPHGSYDQVAILPVVDELPGAVDFLGFVDEADRATGADPSTGPVDIGGNLVAAYDAGSESVTIRQKDGTRLQAGGSLAAYVAVKVNDASAPIVNRIGDTFAEIVPLRSVSVGDFVWVDSVRDGRQDDGEPGIEGVVLEVVGPDGKPVVDVFGQPVGPVTTGADGAYTFDRLPALTGDGTYTVRIDRDASAEALKPYMPTKAGEGDRVLDSSTWEAATVPGELQQDGDRDPTLDFGFVTKSYAIGDRVWIDTDKDGIQGSGEKSLPGVTVELLDEDGAVLATTTTDRDGRYAFDELAAGTYRVRFTLTPEQQRTYEFTQRDAGGDDALDSDADPANGLTVVIVLDDSNAALQGDYEHREITATQGIDPTWDAGVVVKTPPTGIGTGEETGDPEGDDPAVSDGSGSGGSDSSEPAEASDGQLSRTGTSIGLGLVALMLALFGAGGAILWSGRRRTL
ncbi:carboxypeptidase regulatory-like domain-containing protein [Aeromicrobium sp. Marseille-Q0843]|uniref:Carboxypeptidase regulatory-like domain-containing protein n=1 Tax=Aeromicrobium phoceense TaxID=2754045 RepID=A0A838XNB6_9ACTN|nr:SdrD B-like domain-containing protein [Aeromicrobium phoceense]MBA4608453.1 carboxypeptidase regulatory-like domain-containing protein [Aeromicrobium phoceense]